MYIYLHFSILQTVITYMPLSQRYDKMSSQLLEYIDREDLVLFRYKMKSRKALGIFQQQKKLCFMHHLEEIRKIYNEHQFSSVQFSLVRLFATP